MSNCSSHENYVTCDLNAGFFGCEWKCAKVVTDCACVDVPSWKRILSIVGICVGGLAILIVALYFYFVRKSDAEEQETTVATHQLSNDHRFGGNSPAVTYATRDTHNNNDHDDNRPHRHRHQNVLTDDDDDDDDDEPPHSSSSPVVGQVVNDNNENKTATSAAEEPPFGYQNNNVTDMPHAFSASN